MATANLNIRLQPYRLMTKAEAAHYCRRSPKKFEAQCPVRPVEMADGDRLWDVRDLDQWIDSLKASGNGDGDDIVARLG
jgi:predicted alpha/beta hydrolase family esterase